jgi:hypothetical protein
MKHANWKSLWLCNCNSIFLCRTECICKIIKLLQKKITLKINIWVSKVFTIILYHFVAWDHWYEIPSFFRNGLVWTEAVTQGAKLFVGCSASLFSSAKQASSKLQGLLAVTTEFNLRAGHLGESRVTHVSQIDFFVSKPLYGCLSMQICQGLKVHCPPLNSTSTNRTNYTIDSCCQLMEHGNVIAHLEESGRNKYCT